MGRIKTALIKRSAQQLYDSMDIFSEDFEHNKRLLKNKMPSKSVGNKIAGQLVNLAKKDRVKKEKREKKDGKAVEQQPDPQFESEQD